MIKNNMLKKIFSGQKLEKGTSLYFVVIISALLLAMAIGLSTISTSQLKLLNEMNYSLRALYAADSGIESVLYKDKQCSTSSCEDLGDCLSGCSGIQGTTTSSSLDNGATYLVVFSDKVSSASSTGEYKGVQRDIHVTSTSSQ